MIEVLPEWTPLSATSSATPSGETRPHPAAGDPSRGTGQQLTLGDFSAALAKAGLLDNRVVDLPGAVVVSPDGVALLNVFRDRVHSIYRRHGLQEHEYPLLSPTSSLRPVGELLDLDDKLLYAVSGATEQWPPDIALLPSGEAAIYTHWAKTVRSRGDLPIRMYRRARYFRPTSRGRHAGRGVFYAMEHDDIFEFHCAFGSAQEQRDELHRYWEMLKDVMHSLHVPALWSMRPPWTNRHEVADWTLAADVPLPVMATAQVSSLYNQGTRFSVPFKIGFREHGELHNTRQLCGYVSRRLLLVHLLLGMTPSGRFFVHPELAPTQVALLLPSARASEQAFAAGVVERLLALGIRAQLSVLPPTARAGAALDACLTQGTPVVAMLVGPRAGSEGPRLVLRRSDDFEREDVIPADDVDALVRKCSGLLSEICLTWDARASRYLAERVVEVADADEVREVLAERQVAVCPLAVEENAVREIDAWGAGEVLGFCRSGEAQRCVHTGRSVDTVAIVSPRI